MHKNQALVLVNYGDASGKEIINLAEKIQKTIDEKLHNLSTELILCYSMCQSRPILIFYTK